MQRMFERAEPATMAVIATYTDPIMVGLIVLGWGADIIRTVRERKASAAPAEALPGAVPGGDGREAHVEDPGAPTVDSERLETVPVEQLRRTQPLVRPSDEGAG
jgi:hypothetical protein